MGGKGNIIRLWGLAAGVSIIVSLAGLSFPASAGYPRQVAIAPFVSQSQDNIAPVVGILPRLLASRLMAIAGAEVAVLPPGAAPPEEAARAAKVPLLLQGTLSKLGKGYSIDVTALDLATGRPAGAFFAAAATEDEIIARLGDLSAEVAEALFDVKPKARAAAAASPPAPPAPAPSSPALPAPAASAPPETTMPAAAAPAPAAPPAEPRVPTSLKAISESDKIPDELYGIAAVAAFPDGTAEVVAYGARTLYFYKVKGKELLPSVRIARSLPHHFLNVEAADVDGDGTTEVLVTDRVGDDFHSFILKRQGDTYEEAAGDIPYFLVVLPDWMGRRVVVGQRGGLDTAFSGKLVAMAWDGKTLKPGEPLPAKVNISPLSSGIPGLSSTRLGKEWRLIYTDEEEQLRVLDPRGKSEYKSKAKYGAGADHFEWGPVVMIEGRRSRLSLRKAARVVPAGESTAVLIPQSKRGLTGRATGTFDESRLVVLRWTGGGFEEAAATPMGDRFYSGADILPPPAAGKTGVATVIEKFGSAFKDMASRIVLFEAD